MKNEKLKSIVSEALEGIKKALKLDEINELRNRFLGKKSELSSLGGLIATLPVEEKKTFGIEMNEAKQLISQAFEEKLNALGVDSVIKMSNKIILVIKDDISKIYQEMF